jgi:hypothetical protein
MGSLLVLVLAAVHRDCKAVLARRAEGPLPRLGKNRKGALPKGGSAAKKRAVPASPGWPPRCEAPLGVARAAARPQERSAARQSDLELEMSGRHQNQATDPAVFDTSSPQPGPRRSDPAERRKNRDLFYYLYPGYDRRQPDTEPSPTLAKERLAD